MKSRKVSMDFLAAISHEIRNPVNILVGLIHLLQSSDSETEKKTYFDGLVKTSESLLELVNNIMDFSKIESGKFNLFKKPTDLEFSIRQSLLGHQTIAEAKGLDFRLEMAQDLPAYVYADSVKLNQVILNLVSNAIKFTEKGSVEVSVILQEKTENEVSVLFRVSDTGKGIPASKLNSIFDAFDQGTEDINLKFGGTGLGLSISKQVISLLGGDLQVKSIVGAGSEFYFVLRFEIASAGADSLRDGKGAEKVEKLSVMVVDDSDLNAMVVQKSLEKLGFHVVLAHNGLNAVKQVQEKKIDIVLMDVHMPEMDGLEAAQVINNLPGMGELPIIAITGSTDFFSGKDIRSSKFSDYLIKPFHPEELLQKIRKNLSSQVIGP